MSIRKILLALLAFGVILFICCVLFVDFRIASSKSTVTCISSTEKSLLNGTDPAVIPQTTRRIYLHVNNRTGLNESLAWQLRGALAKTGRFEITLVNNAPEADDHPLLLVDSQVDEFGWWVFRGTCKAKLKFGYATDTAAISTEAPESQTLNANLVPERFQLRLYGTVDVDDVTNGLVSRTAYRKGLTEDPANRITKAIVEALDEIEKDAKMHQSNQS